jgi:hypothetical protein
MTLRRSVAASKQNYSMERNTELEQLNVRGPCLFCRWTPHVHRVTTLATKFTLSTRLEDATKVVSREAPHPKLRITPKPPLRTEFLSFLPLTSSYRRANRPRMSLTPSFDVVPHWVDPVMLEQTRCWCSLTLIFMHQQYMKKDQKDKLIVV